MKKAILVLVSISFLAFFLPANHTTVTKSTEVAKTKTSVDPIYPPI